MNARLLYRYKHLEPDGSLIEMVVWEVPSPVLGSSHRFKYRFVYIVDGQRFVGFDNERGKGDHYHIFDEEQPYGFTTVDQLVEDFIEAIEQWKHVAGH